MNPPNSRTVFLARRNARRSLRHVARCFAAAFLLCTLCTCFAGRLAAQTFTMYGVDSSEKVHSALQTAITSGQAMSTAVPFKVLVTTGDGALFARIPKPFILTIAPQAENATTAIEEFIVSVVSGDTLYLTKRALSNTTAHTWSIGSYVGMRITGLHIKQLQDSLNWLTTHSVGSGTVTNVATAAPLTGGPITSTGTISIPKATAHVQGYLDSADWQTFNAKANAFSVASPLDYSLNVITLPQASAVQAGYLTSADWNTFKAKLDSLPSQSGNSGKVLSTDGAGTLSWISAGGTGTVSSVNVSGGGTGMAFSGGPVTASGTITMGGTLAVTNGGTGAASPNAALVNLLPDTTGHSGHVLSDLAGGGFGWVAGGGAGGSGTVTSVNVSGGTTGLTATGGPVTTSGTITLGGTLALANGGTGATTQPAALKAVTPDTTSNTGKVLGVVDGGGIGWVHNGATVSYTQDSAQLVGNTNNLLLGDAGFVRLKNMTAGSVDLTGISTYGISGREIVLTNASTEPIVVKSNSASSTAANRFQTHDGGDLILVQHGTATFVYDGSAQVWQLINTNN